eukprot:g23081.t1
MPGIALQAVPTALPPEVAAQLFPNMPLGGAILSPATLDAGFLINLSNVVAAQAPAPTAPWARTLENQVGADVHGGRSNARQWQQLLVRCQKGKILRSQLPKWHRRKREKASHKQEAGKRDSNSTGKVLSLASELPKPQTATDPQAFATQVQQHLQMQLQQQQEIQRQLRTQLSTQPSRSEPDAVAAPVSPKRREQKSSATQAGRADFK